MSDSQKSQFYDEDSECALLGCILMDGVTVLKRVTGLVSGGDFYQPRHSYIWQAMGTLADSEIDIITVSERLSAMGKLKDSGGDAYMAHLIGCVSSISLAEAYAKIVKGKSVTRALIRTLQTAQADIMRNADDNPLDQLQAVQNALKAIELPQSAPTFQDTLLAYVKERESLWDNPDQQNGYSWGYPLFDKSWGLLKPSHFILVLGIANSGKSLFVATVLDKLITAKVRTGFITLEMQNSEVLDRLTTIRTGYDFDEERVNQDPMARRAMLKYWGELYESPIELSDKPVSIDDIPTRIYEWERLSGERVKVLIVDYTTLVRPSKRMEKAQGHEKFADISAQLKIIANELGICIIGVGQLNRGAYGDSAPELEDVGKSLAFTQDPNMILAIQRGNEENPNIMTIHHLKARSKAKSSPIDLLQDGLQLKVISYTQTPPKGY